MEVSTQSKSKNQITRSVQCKFNCISVKYDGTPHGIYLVNTFYDLFRHICMSPDSPVSHMKSGAIRIPSVDLWCNGYSGRFLQLPKKYT